MIKIAENKRLDLGCLPKGTNPGDQAELLNSWPGVCGGISNAKQSSKVFFHVMCRPSFLPTFFVDLMCRGIHYPMRNDTPSMNLAAARLLAGTVYCQGTNPSFIYVDERRMLPNAPDSRTRKYYHAGAIVGNNPPSRDFLDSCEVLSPNFGGPRPLPGESKRLDASVDRGDIDFRGLFETGGRTPGTATGFSGGVTFEPRGALAFAARHHRIHLP